MPRGLVTLVLLIGIVSLAAVACGGGSTTTRLERVQATATAEAEAVAAVAAAAAPAAGEGAAAGLDTAEAAATATAVAMAAGEVKSGVTGSDPETGAILYSIYVVGGGGFTGVKSNTYGAVPFFFEVEEITFNAGDTVTFTAIPTDDAKQQHTFSVQKAAGGFAVARMKYGKSGTVTVTFDESGTFTYRCDIHTGEGMVGTITVQ